MPDKTRTRRDELVGEWVYFWWAAKYRSGMALDELRQAREMTQVHLAKILGVNQAAVSKMERRADMYLTTLQDFVKAMGGELKIIAQFPDRTVEIRQFEEVVK